MRRPNTAGRGPHSSAPFERAETQLRLLAFSLDGRRYGLPLAASERVLRMVAISPLPGAPEVVLGAINLHGAVIPVLDVRRRLGLPARELGPSAHLLVARTGQQTVALPADDVEGIIDVAPASIVPPDSLLPGIEYVSGVAALSDGLLLIHDVERFFSVDEEQQLAEALEGGGS